MIEVKIPGFKKLAISSVIFDYNGTLAKDGIIKDSTKKLLTKLSNIADIYVITADTFGNAKKELNGLEIELKILSSKDHTAEKEEFVKSFKDRDIVSIGNGNNDAKMLKSSTISIAIIGEEGCSKEALRSSDIICKDIDDAINLLLHPKRLKATLRR